MRNVCIVVGSRANYSSIKAVMRSVQRHPDLRLQVVAAASALLDRFGSVVDIVEADGFSVDARLHMIVEGETPATMAKSTGLGLLEFPTIFNLLRPDVVVTVGDRFETMATAIAAVYMNIPLAHTMGGEVTGTIDESVRHAVTKLAHIHFPATEDAARRIVAMGEDPETVHMVGCPRMDLVAAIVQESHGPPETEFLRREGVGGEIDFSAPFLLVSQHPVTTEYGLGEKHIGETLAAVESTGLPAVMLWPNADAGSEDISRGMRIYREHTDYEGIRFYKNFPVETFVRLMTRCACMVGNSSAAIREGAFLGAPAVNIGTRQAGRERGQNIIDVDYKRDEIQAAIARQVEHGRYASDPLYGDGCTGDRIADILATCPFSIQKQIRL